MADGIRLDDEGVVVEETFYVSAGGHCLASFPTSGHAHITHAEGHVEVTVNDLGWRRTVDQVNDDNKSYDYGPVTRLDVATVYEWTCEPTEPSMQDTLEPATKNHFGTWQGSWHVTDNHGVHVTVDERRFSVDFGDGPTEHLWQTKQITDETRFFEYVLPQGEIQFLGLRPLIFWNGGPIYDYDPTACYIPYYMHWPPDETHDYSTWIINNRHEGFPFPPAPEDIFQPWIEYHLLTGWEDYYGGPVETQYRGWAQGARSTTALTPPNPAAQTFTSQPTEKTGLGPYKLIAIYTTGLVVYDEGRVCEVTTKETQVYEASQEDADLWVPVTRDPIYHFDIAQSGTGRAILWVSGRAYLSGGDLYVNPSYSKYISKLDCGDDDDGGNVTRKPLVALRTPYGEHIVSHRFGFDRAPGLGQGYVRMPPVSTYWHGIERRPSGLLIAKDIKGVVLASEDDGDTWQSLSS